MTDPSARRLPDPATPGEPPASDDAELVGRLRFFFEYRHTEPLARLRARSILAQLRVGSDRRR